MYDLDTIKRLNRNPSKRSQPGNRQDKPAPQPTFRGSLSYAARARIAVRNAIYNGQSPAMDREPLDHA